MKQRIPVVLILLLSSLAWAQFAPVPLYNASITFYEDGKDPVLYGPPRVCERVGIQYAGTNKRIDSLEIHHDSLIISTVTDSGIKVIPLGTEDIISPYYSYTVVFERMGVYEAFENDLECKKGNSCGLVSLGAFRILPQISTQPAGPVTTQDVTLNLVAGQILDGCIHYEKEQAVVKDSVVLVSYTESWEPCDLYRSSPERYGPSFSLGKLAAGAYTVMIEDSVAAGSFTVADPLVLPGVVTIMKHPLTKSMDIPIPEVEIVAEVYYPCPWYLPPDAITGTVCSTATDANGSFKLELPRANLNYDVTAAVKGYYTQTICRMATDTSLDFIHFKLIPVTDESLTTVDVTVTNNGVPVESVSISLTGGHELAICPMLLKAKTAATVYTNYSGYTDKQGKLQLKNVSLVPYIDYIYTAYKYVNQRSLYAAGSIRFYQAAGWTNAITIDFGGTAVSPPRPTGMAGIYLNVHDNPVRKKEATISYAHTGGQVILSLYTNAGVLLQTITGGQTGQARVSLKGAGPGLYILKAQAGAEAVYRKILVP